MLQYQENTITFSIYEKFPELLCVFSTRQWGDLSFGKEPIKSAREFLKKIKISENQVVVSKQCHSSRLTVVYKNKDSNSIIFDNDALITVDKDLYLGVRVGDCVPLFFYDPVAQIVAVAHAGWRGTIENIVGNVIHKMKNLGSTTENIYAAIGPHIGGCCYDIPKERADLFSKSFKDETVVFTNHQNWYLDLGKANYLKLLELGLQKDHIDAPLSCTSCQNDTYFSFRKDTRETFGEMLGIIGIRSN